MISTSRHVVQIQYAITRSVAAGGFRDEWRRHTWIVQRNNGQFKSNLIHFWSTQLDNQIALLFWSKSQTVFWIITVCGRMILAAARSNALPFAIYNFLSDEFTWNRFEFEWTARVCAKRIVDCRCFLIL